MRIVVGADNWRMELMTLENGRPAFVSAVTRYVEVKAATQTSQPEYEARTDICAVPLADGRLAVLVSVLR